MANKDNIKLWVEALRSDEYEQGAGALRIGRFLCCLGVACETYQECIGGLEITVTGFRGSHEYDGESGELPVAVFEWLGLERDPLLIGEKRAIFLNDDDGLSFNEIADAIEATYLQ